jgi:predicted SprT family Zn-dependent metalloprotease|tara:strand:+ start:988 stop:1461 length:474 start_codon:yes stop_codon:yes gene_type:complete
MTNRRHLDAIEELAQEALREHGLAQKGWTFQWNRAVRRSGICRFGKRRIGLSKPLAALNSFAESKDTILHEIAHALAGFDAGHGPRWVALAKSIGCNGERCAGRAVVLPPSKFIGTCPVCSGRLRRNRRTRCACASCCRRLNDGRWAPQFELRWTRG